MCCSTVQACQMVVVSAPVLTQRLLAQVAVRCAAELVLLLICDDHFHHFGHHLCEFLTLPLQCLDESCDAVRSTVHYRFKCYGGVRTDDMVAVPTRRLVLVRLRIALLWIGSTAIDWYRQGFEVCVDNERCAQLFVIIFEVHERIGRLHWVGFIWVWHGRWHIRQLSTAAVQVLVQHLLCGLPVFSWLTFRASVKIRAKCFEAVAAAFCFTVPVIAGLPGES